MSERLQLKKDEPAHEAISCPGCGKPLGVGAVICVQCGYDTRTGRRVDTSGGRKISPLVVIGLLLVVIASGVVVYLRSQDDGVVPTPPPAPRAPEPVAVSESTATESPASPAPTAPEAATSESAAPEAAAAESVATVAAGAPQAEAAQAPAEPQIDWEEVAARQRERILTEFNRRTPMFEEGESVELRQGNGLIRRGIFRGVQNAEVQLETEGKEVQRLPFDQLDRHTRLRVDEDYRERYVDYLTRQRITEMRRAQEPKP